MSMIENNVINLKYILKLKQMVRNLLALFGSTRGIPVKKLKVIATQKKKEKKKAKSLWFKPGGSIEF